MTDITQMIQNGSAHVWLYIPIAILLGALHGLEPGHSKTMMAAFIIAIRGTVWQAVLLGLSAAISHSLIIWVLAALALHYGSQWNAESIEPYLQIVSAVLIFGLAIWMYYRTRRDLRDAAHHHDGHHHHDHDDGHTHEHQSHAHDHAHSELFVLDTGHGKIELSVFEEGVPPVFRLRAPAGEKLPAAADVTIETNRPDGARQTFAFVSKGDFLESRDDIPEPHEFDVLLTLGHGGHSHTCRAEFREAGHHHHAGEEAPGFEDAHERAHALDIQKRFANRAVTTPQIVMFGITGGLMPCPAAFTILLVCLQLKRATLGFAIVGAFSFGLALTMVTVGALAAWSVQHAEKRFSGFSEVMRKAPYVSCVLLTLLALFMAWSGWHGLQVHHQPPSI